MKSHLTADDDTIVIGADSCRWRWTYSGKPADKKEAQDMLNMLENRWHEVTTEYRWSMPRA